MMPVGQFKIRRNPATGRIEKIPEEEQQALVAEATARESPQEDPFIAERREAPVAEEPVRIPPVLPQEAAPPEAAAEEEPGVGAAEVGGIGAGIGGLLGGPPGAAAGAAIGGAVGFLASKVAQPTSRPIGTLEGGTGTQQSDRTLLELLAVTKEVARIGTPIKGAIKTVAAGSRI